MKKIFLGLACIALTGLSTSCHDFLEENPKTDITAGQYFSFPAHAHAAVNHLYRNGAIGAWDAGVYRGCDAMLGPWLSGLYDNDYAGQEAYVQYSTSLTLTAQNVSGKMDEVWDRGYQGIARANNAIAHIAETPGLEANEIASLLAQAKFFRAFNYFYLVRHFGGVPLILEPYEDLEDLYVERADIKTVYAQIEKDLTEAINSNALPEVQFVNGGYRITLGTAQTVLAHVYMQMAGEPVNDASAYGKAATMARAVINSSVYSLVQHDDTGLGSAYNKLRTENNLPEIIFAREYDNTEAHSGTWHQFAFPQTRLLSGMQYSITNLAYHAKDEVLEMFDPVKDLRIQEKQYFFTEITRPTDGVSFQMGVKASPWMFYNETSTWYTGRGNKDKFIYRYAEVLLIAAEAIAKSDPNNLSEAKDYLAQVRGRAYNDYNAALAEVQGFGVDAFVQEVWKERLRELVFDFRIFDDIQRTRHYPQTINGGNITFVPVLQATNPSGKKFEEKHMLWPIPANERQRNPELGQNPGY